MRARAEGGISLAQGRQRSTFSSNDLGDSRLGCLFAFVSYQCDYSCLINDQLQLRGSAQTLPAIWNGRQALCVATSYGRLHERGCGRRTHDAIAAVEHCERRDTTDAHGRESDSECGNE